MWLSVGAVAGSGATVWARRRVERLARRVQSGQIAGEVVTMVDHGARSTAGHVRRSIETGRSAARRRQHELHHELELRDPGR
jgi:Ni2+-binding GTPase involved in maturation of urease and hydrogenase